MDLHPLDPDILRTAYSKGFFPMPEPDTGEVLWYCPDPRAIIPIEAYKSSKSLLRSIRKFGYRATYDYAFSEVMQGCAERPETWINEEFFIAYQRIHELGFAHSVEIWNPTDELVGGVYGVQIGAAFFAESKFHRATDASKAGLHFLVERLRAQHFRLLEVQFLTQHLASLGAIEIPRSQYLQLLREATRASCQFL